jgi:isopenicillin N synthase-like dioxygenase
MKESTMTQAHLPIIDISPLFKNDPTAQQATVAAIDTACRHMGFFYITGHGINNASIEGIRTLADQFFKQDIALKKTIDVTQSTHHRGYGDLSAEQLNAQAPDYKETFDMGWHLPEDHPEVLAAAPLRGGNRHPDIAGWVSTFEAHYHTMHALSLVLLRAMAQGLGLTADFFSSKLHEPMSIFRVIRYPERPFKEDDRLIAGEHTDYGCLTLLQQDMQGGLQVQTKDGEWIDAPPVPGSFVVNIGDMMMRWTNNTYQSTPHRVVNRSGKERYSMPFFVEPNPNTMIECLPNYTNHQAANFAPIRAVDYLLGRFASTYTYRDELQNTNPAM